jgi:membrane fusion protein, adhesin transport system
VAKSANDRLQRTEITAPVDGIVNSISINTLGGIVKPGEILVELTPVTDKIVIEAKAAPSDRGFIHPGLLVQVRMNSYEVSEYGILNGKITKVGSDSTQDTRGQSFYQVNIAVDSLTPLFKGKEIVPGMVVTADIVTGKRTILKYLLSPLTKFTYNIFKDPK